MCFYIPDGEEYYSFDLPSSLFKGRKTITCYKVLYRNDIEGYYSPYQLTTYPKSGVVKSDRITKRLIGLERRYGITKGIHVYTDLKEAQHMAIYTSRVVIPVICESKDFVAYNSSTKEAVFMKVRIHNRAKDMKNFKRSK